METRKETSHAGVSALSMEGVFFAVHLNPCLMNQPPSSQPTGPALRGMCFVFSGTFLSHEKSLISDVLYSLPDCVGAMVSSCLVCPIQVGNSDQPSPPHCGRPSTPGNPAPDRLKAQSTAKNSAFETKSSQATYLAGQAALPPKYLETPHRSCSLET